MQRCGFLEVDVSVTCAYNDSHRLAVRRADTHGRSSRVPDGSPAIVENARECLAAHQTMKPFSVAVLAPFFAAVALVSGAGPGCATSCDDAVGGDPKEIRSGTTDPTGSFYESVTWGGEYLAFRPEEELKFFHGLRGTPSSVQVYVAFVRTPLSDPERGNASEAAGNLAIYRGVTKEFVKIRNDTCETFYVRIAASNPFEDPETDGTAGIPGL